MASIKWKRNNWMVCFEKFDNFHFIRLIVERLNVFNFYPFFFLLLSLISHSLVRFEHVF